MNDPKENALQNVLNVGKGILSVLKEQASETITETKVEALQAGEGLVEKLLYNIKHIGFVLVAVLLFMVAAVEGLSELMAIPIWASALGLSVIVYGASVVYKAKAQPAKIVLPHLGKKPGPG